MTGWDVKRERWRETDTVGAEREKERLRDRGIERNRECFPKGWSRGCIPEATQQ